MSPRSALLGNVQDTHYRRENKRARPHGWYNIRDSRASCDKYVDNTYSIIGDRGTIVDYHRPPNIPRGSHDDPVISFFFVFLSFPPGYRKCLVKHTAKNDFIVETKIV